MSGEKSQFGIGCFLNLFKIFMNLKKHFEEKGYAIGEKIFSNDDLKIFNDEFDTILNQLINSGENINAKWGSSLTDHIEPEDSKVIHFSFNDAK